MISTLKHFSQYKTFLCELCGVLTQDAFKRRTLECSETEIKSDQFYDLILRTFGNNALNELLSDDNETKFQTINRQTHIVS
jgi:hypothetical protein